MTQANGGAFNDITIAVSLKKGIFRNQSDNSLTGFGTGNEIATDWSFVINSVKNGSNQDVDFDQNQKTFTYKDDPTQEITVSLKVVDAQNNPINNLSDVKLTYFLISPLTTGNSFNSCTQAQIFSISEVIMGGLKPCTGYTLIITRTADNVEVYKKTQATDPVFSVTGLNQGDYSYVITDGCNNALVLAPMSANARKLPGVFTINAAAQLGTNVVFAGKLCAGDTTGIAVLKVSGAKKPITWVLSQAGVKIFDELDTGNYTKDGDSDANLTTDYTLTFTGLATGDYTFTFKDANGCIKVLNFSVIAASALAHDFLNLESDIGLACAGDINGKLTFRGRGGWTEGFTGNPFNIEGNWGNAYTFELYNVADLNTPISSDTVPADGSFDINTGKKIGYEAVFSGLSAGEYRLKLKELVAINNDANPSVNIGCEILFPKTYIISAPEGIEIKEKLFEGINCAGDLNGNITIEVLGGTPNYNIQWSARDVAKDLDGNTLGNFDATPGVLKQENLAFGRYEVTVTDSKGCVAVKSWNFLEKTELKVSIDDPIAIVCYGNADGEITARITQSSVAPFTYTLTGTDYDDNPVNKEVVDTNETSVTFTGLKAGINYKVIITDKNNCSKTTGDKEIVQPASGMSFESETVSDFNGFQIKCNNGTDGSIEIGVTGGVGGYTYAWTKDGAALADTTKKIDNLAAGDYTVVVTDGTGECTITKRWNLNDPGPLNITKINMPVANQGAYTFQGENGNSKYWKSNNTATWLEARDTASAHGGYLVAIDNAAENQFLLDSPVGNVWIGLNDIVLENTFKWIPGSSVSTYLNWGDGEPNDAANSFNEDYVEILTTGLWNDLKNLSAKEFVVEYTTNGTTVSEFNGFSISCFGANDGKITLMPTGGTGTYTYAWTKDGVAIAATTKDIENLGPGIYVVTVTDNNTCNVTGSFTISEPPQLTASLDNTVSTVINCFNQDGSIKVDIDSESVAPYSYKLTGEDHFGDAIDQTLTDQSVDTITFKVKAGTYQVTVTDANGCSVVTSDVTLTQPSEVINVSNIIVKEYFFYGSLPADRVNISCNGGSDGEISFEVSGGTPGYTYAWTKDGVAIATTSEDQTGLSAGLYEVTVTDSNGFCSVVKVFDLKEPKVLEIVETESDFNGKNITCNGKNDGFINLDIKGGTKFTTGAKADSYTILWVASNGGQLVDNNTSINQTQLRKGTYTVTVTDINNCTVTEIYTIDEPDVLEIKDIIISDDNGFNIGCNGATSGAIRFDINGGVTKADGSYNYAWTTANGSGLDATSKNQSGLSAGTYTLTVTDLNDCTLINTFVLEEPDPIVVASSLSDFTGFNIKCNGENNGAITITGVTGGFIGNTNVYTYSWSLPAGSTGSGLVANVANQTGLTAGTYKLTVTDDNSCSTDFPFELKEPPVIDFVGNMSNYNSFEVSINGQSDGTITIVPSGGAPDINGLYTYNWTTSTVGAVGLVNNDQNQDGLSAGVYTLVMTDSNGCEHQETFTLDEPNELIIDLGTDPTNILCHDESTGLFKAIITKQSVAPYTYTLNGKDHNEIEIEEVTVAKNDLEHTFNVKAGTYTITVTDLNGAFKKSVSRKFTHPALPLTISETISLFRNDAFNISCNGASDGEIDAVASGGTLNGGQYDYTWTTDDGTTIINTKNKKQTGLGPGKYTLTVIDQNLCTIKKEYTLTEPDPILYQVVSEKDITCFGDSNGAIEISVTLGTGIYTYAWSTENGSGLNVNGTTIQTGLGPGTYKLDLTDGCETLQFIYEIEEPAFLIINVDEKENILCFGEASGKISVTVSGGTAPYNYEWEDNLGNKYNRDIGNVFNRGDLSNIPFGVYDLKVTDFNGCITTESNVELTQPEDLVVGIVKTDLNCFGLNDGTITVTPTGGVAPYTYEWSDFGNGAIRADLSAGTYTVKVIDKNLCEESVDVIIKQAPLFNIVPVVTPVTCFGAKDGTISLNIDGGESPITVTWADDATAGVNRTNLKPGNYNVVLTDGFGCVIDEVFQIFEPRELTLSAISSDALDCDNPLSGSIDLQVIGGNPPYSILWSTGETSEDITGLGANNYSVTVTDSKGCRAEKTFVVKRQFEMEVNLDTSLRYVCDSREVYQVNKLTISGGIFPYTVAWSDGDVLANGQSMETKSEGDYQVVVTDGLGCTKTILFDVVLPKLGLPDFDYTSFYLVNFNALTYDDPVTFSNLSTENFQSVEWDFGDGSTSSLNDPIHTYTKAGSYDVTIYVKYAGGCLYSLTKTIFIGDSYELELPNAFTPNSDGLNDTFRPVYYGLTEVNMKVFDTWGTLIYFEKADKNKLIGWNGTINGKLAENGNYIYQVEGKAFNGDLVYKNGPFTLLR